MAAPPSLLLLVLATLTISSLILLPTTTAQSAATPAAAPAAPISIMATLSNNTNQYSQFMRLLNETNSYQQIDNQVNNSRDGVTVFAPTDNAFQNLPTGTLNNLTFQQHVQLVLYHICPKYYSLQDLESVSNPVRTQATGQEGGVWGLYFSGQSNQVNVSTGIVNVPIYNAVRKDSPLAVYQVDKVLLPKEFYEAKAPAAAPPAADGNATSTRPRSGGAAATPATGSPGNGSVKMSAGLGLVSAIWVVCMGLMW